MMSISMERNCDAIDRSRFLHGMRRGSIYDSATGGAFAGDRRFPDEGEEDSGSDSDSCSSTSIGRNSDLSSEGEEEDPGETKVRSSYKDPLDTMDDLEDVLPVRKGISKFYNGKSKSFTSLADACAASNVKEIVKPENPYTNKRMFWERNHNTRGVSKKLTNCSQSSAVLVTMSSESNSLSSSPACSRPPLHPRGKRSTCVEASSPESPPPNPMRGSPWRSFSLSDLQSVAAAVIPNNEGKVH